MLDPVAESLARAWGFVPHMELPAGHCSRVYADADRVLKVPFQGEEQQSGRLAAERLSGGVGVRVIRSDVSTGALLMDRVIPGTTLEDSGLDDADCRRILLELGERIRGLDPTGLLPVAQYVSRRDPLALELLATAESSGFLHGDLHHGNVLRGPAGWVVIDPKGLAGDPAFEPSAYMRNALEKEAAHRSLRQVLEDRIEEVAASTGFDPWRIAAWTMVAVGTGDHGERWQRVQEALESLLPRLSTSRRFRS